jgi:NIMA (never in mitosis gene a)-related kinase
VLKALKCLHSADIVHRDIKSANIFLYSPNRAKLGDLNVSKIIRGGLKHTQTGTPYYAAPEVWRDQPQTGKSDIWSLGCVLFELMSFQPPFRSETMPGLYKQIIRAQIPAMDELPYSEELKDMVRLLLQVSQDDRPSAADALRLPVIKSLEDEILPDYFQERATKGASRKPVIHRPLFMPKNPHNLHS